MKMIQTKEFISQTGQGIVEYIVLIAVVITVLIVFVGRGGVFEKSYSEVIDIQASDITGISTKLFK